jgi:hypothetical protein
MRQAPCSGRWRPWGAADFFFLSYLVAITFPIEFDVWGRLCTHFEGAKVMTFAPVTKKWLIITEISKEVENNAIARLNAYAKQYVPRRTGAAGGSSSGGGSSGRS